NLVVDKSGPATSGVSAAPNPNNGNLPINQTSLAVRVSATAADTASGNSNIAAAEGFIDVVGANGSGFQFVPSDGQFNSPSEVILSDIPLSTVALLSDGNHTIYVHGRDAAGNWGGTSSTTLVVDKTRPTLSGVSASPNPTAGALSVTLTATANDATTGITAAEWFVGADPGVGLATPMTVSGTGPWNLSAAINVAAWTDGNYTLSVRAKDGAQNWSLVGTTVLTVTHPLYFSTLGNSNPPGVGGTSDDADIYFWSGTNYSRVFDATTFGLPTGASVDGYDRVDATHFYLSFSGTNTAVPGLGNVQDEDVVYYNAGVWSVFFDGTAHGMTANNQDLDAISVVGGVLYFSTSGSTNPPGVTGTADDADIYSWNGTSYARVWDATANGLPGGANVDGLVFIDATHFYLSFAGTTTAVPGLGNVADTSVVYNNADTWSNYFVGPSHGLTAGGNLDIDAFDLP
nr:hypothetical protein [Anaerolinea sp.]